MPYRYEWTVGVGETDFSGRIYTPELIDCLAEGLEGMMCEVGYGPKRAFEEGIVYPAVHTEAEYLSPIGLNDNVSVTMVPTIGTTSVRTETDGHIDGEKVFWGEITAVFVDNETSETVPVPDDVRHGLRNFVND